MLCQLLKFANRALGLTLIVSALGGTALAGVVDVIPELDPASASSAIALLAAAALVARDKLRR